MNRKSAISPTREEDYPTWYQEVIKAADLAEHSPVRGCMVIKPWGYSIWENIQAILNAEIKKRGYHNVYFPLFIPLSFLEKEAGHVEGFAKECAVVTHHRLEKKEEKLIPTGELEEPLIVRPTSEMIVGEMFSKWIESYRDLPLLINQWANIVRWEMRTRMFLRTTEILWQEGHTVHASEEEARRETLQMLDMYGEFSNRYLAIPVVEGEKTEREKFPGAVSTYAIEAMMQDGKALQLGTSHFLGQNFSRACNVKFRDKQGTEKYGWMTSWGVSTRLVGAVVMTHSDDDGLILPPTIAPSHIVILPIVHDEGVKGKVLSYCEKLKEELGELEYEGRSLEIIVDMRDRRGGEKKWSWIKKGVPLIVEVGMRDIEIDSLVVQRRDRLENRQVISHKQFIQTVIEELADMQSSLFKRTLEFKERYTEKIDSKEDFYNFFSEKKQKGGFALAHWSGEEEVEEIVQRDLGVTIRCIPMQGEKERGTCIISGKPSNMRAIFAKAY